MDHHLHKESILKTWLVVFGLMALILGKGFFSFFVVSDLGQPGWDYRPVMDVPAESPYAIYQKLLYPQHVRGAKGE